MGSAFPHTVGTQPLVEVPARMLQVPVLRDQVEFPHTVGAQTEPPPHHVGTQLSRTHTVGGHQLNCSHTVGLQQLHAPQCGETLPHCDEPSGDAAEHGLCALVSCCWKLNAAAPVLRSLKTSSGQPMARP